tara:strand:- start:148 stop:618 length:471 start_codon:yes stop_codon:yes gene_type:complete
MEKYGLKFFIGDTFSKKEIKYLQNVKYSILNTFAKIISKELDLKLDDSLNLIKVDTNKSIATFLDSYSRIKKIKIHKKNNKKICNHLRFFQRLKNQKFYGDNYFIKSNITNLILLSLNKKILNFRKQKIKIINIEDLNLNTSLKIKKWQLLNKIFF